MIDISEMNFWAKTVKNGDAVDQSIPGIDVLHHTMNVGHVALQLTALQQSALTQFHLSEDICALLVALHDIGKITLGFQIKCPAWIDINNLKDHFLCFAWDSLESNHSIVSQFTVQRWMVERFGMQSSTANALAAAVAAHHGKILCSPAGRGMRSEPARGLVDNDEWELMRRETANKLADLFLNNSQRLHQLKIDMNSPGLWWLAGLTTISDWIGSDERFFPADQNLPSEQSRWHAQRACQTIGFESLDIHTNKSFNELFNFAPNDLQNQSMNVIQEPGVYVIEAPMGIGKTEAALACGYKLISDGKANGIYFALPTQTTSNRIHKRLKSFIEEFCSSAPATRLVHANSWLLKDVYPTTPSTTLQTSEDARIGRDWFASSKRALLAPFGVGTIDQALLSVVAAKHFFVRRYALAGKVVILDEVHSYDVYTGTLIHELCQTLRDLGCTVILLSATLTPERRNALLGITQSSDHAHAEPYPLISGYPTGGQAIPPQAASSPPPKKVQIRFEQESLLMEEVWRQAQAGACVLWICDTVNSAQRIYRHFSGLAVSKYDPEIGLLHSRFPLFRREALEEYWMEALGKDGEQTGKRPNGCILVSTQVVEQSVDLDADLLISELAPTDMMLQRIGRLWRHVREQRPLPQSQLWIVSETHDLNNFKEMTAAQIKRNLGSKGAVYAPYVLLRSLVTWLSHPTVTLSVDIRQLLDETYRERNDDPQSWLELRHDLEGQASALRQIALRNTNIWQIQLNDDEGVQTRINSYLQVMLILVRSVTNGFVTLLNGEQANMNSEIFDIDAARALHRNLVRIPKTLFESFASNKKTARYVRGEQALGMIGDDGMIQIDGLKAGISLQWMDDTGVIIHRNETKEIKDEPCD